MKFIRIGGLSPVKQKGNYGEDGFHNAPAKRGIYAFPFGVFEPYLLTGSFEDKWEKVKDYHGNIVSADNEKYWHEKYYPWYSNKIPNGYMLKMKKPKRFEYKEPIWCHLDNYLKRREKKYVIKWHNDWILVDMDLYEKLHQRAKKDLHNRSKDYIEAPKKHMEVFIEQIH